MPFVEKRLSGPVQLTTSAQVLYTTPSGGQSAVMRQIVVTNVTSSTANFTLYIGVESAANALFSASNVAANDTVIINLSQVLSTNEVVRAKASVNSALNITISGVENDGPLAQGATYIPDGAITSSKVADSSITTSKIANSSVSQLKIADGNSLINRFATTAARDAAFGGAGEPTLAEGMTAYIDADNSIYIYDGSNWIKMVSASQPPAMQLIVSQSIVAGTNTVSNCFTTDYDEYLLVLSNLKTTGNNSGLFIALNGNPTIKSNGIYIGMASATVTADPSSSTNGFVAGLTHTTGATYSIRIGQPRTVKNKTFTSQWATPSFVGVYSGIEETGVARTGLIITSGSPILAEGTIYLYGYRK